ncbi:MAG: AAA family ATPase, partial [Bacteroidota bacterium]
MISRKISSAINAQIGKYSIIMISGPRQSGKTTLIRQQFPNLPYFSLENPDVRDQLKRDPKSIFSQYGHRLILDEVQRVPELFSYLQGIVDEDRNSLFVLSGSQNYLMMENVSQTLAGRVALFYLQPLSYGELLEHGGKEMQVNEFIWKGGYPRIYDREVAVNQFYQSYLETYVQRDVRLIQNIGNLDVFTQFLSVCATFIGQELNLNAVASASAISRTTVTNWLSLLEASFLVYRIAPYYRNFKKRIV